MTIGLRVENQWSPVPQGAAGRGFSEKSGRQGRSVKKRSKETCLTIVPGCTDKGENRRNRQRTRYLHAGEIKGGCCMKIATANTRGWHWVLTDAAHQVKTGEILWLLRREKLDVLLLSDVHKANWRTQQESQDGALEEFVMIVGKMSSMILSPAVQAAWQDGKEKAKHPPAAAKKKNQGLHSAFPRRNGYSRLRQQKSRGKQSLRLIPEPVCMWSVSETLTLLSWRQ